MTIRLLPTTAGLVTVSEIGPEVWEVVMNLDGVLWTSWHVTPEDRDAAAGQARRLVQEV